MKEDYWPARLVDRELENPHAVFAFETTVPVQSSQHIHPFHEFVQVIAGAARQLHGDRSYPFNPGDLFFLPADDWHIASAEGRAVVRVVNFYDASFSSSLPADREALAVVRLLAARARARRPRIELPAPVKGRAGALIEEMCAECGHRRPGFHSAAKIRLHELLLLLMRETPLGEALREQPALTLSDARTERLERVLAHIRERLGERLTVGDLARAAGLGHSAFCESFRAYTGHTLVNYVNRLRVDAVCRLLAVDDRPLPIIAESCGFPCFSHFYAIFRSLTGNTPRRFRAAARSGGKLKR